METEKNPAPIDQAKAAIDNLLRDGFGIRIAPDLVLTLTDRGRQESALSFSCRVMLLMGLLFCGIPIVFHLYSPALLTLAVYGVLWSGWSAGTSVLTSRLVTDILYRRILPLLPDQACLDLARDIKLRFPPWKRLLVTWGVGCSAAAIAAWLIAGDPNLMLIGGDRGKVSWQAIAFLWWPEWVILFSAAASVVQVSTFYRLLPRYLNAGLARSLRLDPANAALIQAMASVARVILVFWLGIGLSVAILLPASTWDWANAFPAASPPGSISDLYGRLAGKTQTIPWFVMIEVTVTSCCSLGLGVIIFLFAEGSLRNAAREARLATLERIEVEAGILLATLGTLDEGQLKRLNDLRTLQASLAAVTPYRSIAYSALSVLLPFVPLAGFLPKLH